MARLLGVDIPENKQVTIGLTQIYGIGLYIAKKIVNETSVNGTKKVKDLTNDELSKISNIIDKNYTVEGELRQDIKQNIRRLRDIKSYRGLRHKNSLPVRGQKTRTNSRTRKGKSLAVGGLKRVLDKK